MILISRVTTLMVLAVLASASVFAQEEAPPDASDIVEDRLDRGTPRRSVDGILSAMDSGDFEVAAEYLDLRNLRGVATEFTGEELAKRLYVIVRRAEWTDIASMTDMPDGRSGDGLPNYRDSIGFISDGAKQVEILLQSVPRGDGEHIWKVSNATVSLIPGLYKIYAYPDVIEKLRLVLPEKSFLGTELFLWVAAFSAGVGAYLLILITRFAVKRAPERRGSAARTRLLRFMLGPLGVWSFLMASNWVLSSLGLGVTAEDIKSRSPVSTLITVWLVFSAIDLLRDSYGDRLVALGKIGVKVLLRPISNAIKLLVFIAAVLFYLDRLGFNLTTVLAGLGVGGVAVALALQKPMEDVFGALSLYTQQPVRIGDFCRIGDTTGTIEEIGLRTTFVRTLADTRIAVSNALLASMPMENISAREKILYRPTLRLKYDTTPEQIRSVLERLRSVLDEHDKVLDGHRVRFNEIGDHALSIEIFAYVDVKVWSEYLEIAEDLNLRVIDAVSAAGTSLFQPLDILKGG